MFKVQMIREVKYSKSGVENSRYQLRLKEKLLPPTLVVLGLLFIFFLISDYLEPEEIALQSDSIRGLSVLHAENLLIQGYDSSGRIWATRGMWAYRLDREKQKFIQQYHVPAGLSFFWLRNFSVVRWITRRPECIELLPAVNGESVAMSAGKMWYRSGRGSKFEKTLTLRNYGIGNQGIRHDGLLRIKNGIILFGEYFRNPDRTDVRLYRSLDHGKTWSIAYTFPPGRIRHIHAVQRDPYTGLVWVAAGDSDREAVIAWSADLGKTLNSIGQGGQKWRATQLVFTKDSVFWGADTTRRNSDEAGIYSWNKKTKKLKKITHIDGAIFYATSLTKGTIVMSTVREGGANEKDEITRLWVFSENHKPIPIEFGNWYWKGKYAKLRFQRGQGADAVVISVLNHKKYNNDLIIIPEKELINWVERKTKHFAGDN